MLIRSFVFGRRVIVFSCAIQKLGLYFKRTQLTDAMVTTRLHLLWLNTVIAVWNTDL